MKISSINTTYKIKDNSQVKSNNKNVLYRNMQKDVFFKGKQYPSGYYSDDEIEFAKKHLGEEDWEKVIEEEEYHKIDQKRADELTDFKIMVSLALFFVPFFISDAKDQKKAKENAQPRIAKIQTLMVDLYAEKIALKKAEVRAKAKEYTQDTIIAGAKNELKMKYLNQIDQGNYNIVPTAIMIEAGDKENRDGLIKWLKENSNDRFIEFEHLDDEYATSYRLETELEYAQKRFNDSGQRTILQVKNFDKLLGEDAVNTAFMKDFLSANFANHEPITIVFETEDSSKFVDAFIGNRSRIPLKINIAIPDNAEINASIESAILNNESIEKIESRIATIIKESASEKNG